MLSHFFFFFFYNNFILFYFLGSGEGGERGDQDGEHV